MSVKAETISKEFIWRRVHSLMGLWLVIYLIEHLIVNSQATLWLGDDGIGFIRLVNLLEALPYLQVIEILLIGVPIAVHGYWGIKRALKGKANARRTDGTAPSMTYGRSRAYHWQRLTSWILVFGIVAHVVQMRFLNMPTKIREENNIFYVVQIKNDPGLDTLAERLHIQFEKEGEDILVKAKTPGKAMLFMVRETFKSPVMSVLYSIFVLAAAFHAFNGFWTSLITWGAMLSYRSQKAMLPFCWIGVGLLAFLGLAAIWGSYWLNLRT